MRELREQKKVIGQYDDAMVHQESIVQVAANCPGMNSGNAAICFLPPRSDGAVASARLLVSTVRKLDGRGAIEPVSDFAPIAE